MLANYYLAIVPTLAILVGAGCMFFARRRDMNWGFTLVLVVFATTEALVFLTCLKYPNSAIQRAHYGLTSLVPLCAFGGLGLHVLTRRWRISRVLACAFIGAFALGIYATYWIAPDSTENFRNRATEFLKRDDAGVKPAELILQKGLNQFPQDDFYPLMLGKLATDSGNYQLAHSLLQKPQCDSVWRHVLLFRLAAAEQNTDLATRELKTAAAMDPFDPVPWKLLALWSARGGEPEATISACRDYLRLDYDDAATQETLVDALLAAGHSEDAQRHKAIADAIRDARPGELPKNAAAK